MKKIFVLILALVFIIGVSAVSMANEGSLEDGATVSDTIDVTAEVGQYASVIAGEDMAFDFVGSAEEEAQASSSFNVESNCDVDLDVSVGALTNGTDYIAVEYIIGDPANLTIDTLADGTAGSDSLAEVQGQDDGVVSYAVDATAILGQISAQAAGAYNAVMTITVAAAE